MLDAGVVLAADRGAAAVAAELAEHALRLTSPDLPEEHRRRGLAAARAHQAAGEWTRARTISRDLLVETERTSEHVEALLLLAELESVERALPLLEEALRQADGRVALQAAVHCRLAWAARWRKGIRHATTALALADQLDDDVLRARARAVLAILGWFAGYAEASEDLLERVRDFAPAVGGEQLVQEALQAVANTFAPSSRREEVRAFFERELAEWRDRDERRIARAFWGLAWVELWAGRWTLAAAYAAAALDISNQYGLEVPQDHLPIAVIAAHRGELELAREHSERALALAEEQFLQSGTRLSTWRSSPWSRSGAETIRRLSGFDNADSRAAELGWREPSVRWWTADHVELLLELGRIDEAVSLIDRWEEDATRVHREWVLVQVTRCRGLVAAAQGERRAARPVFWSRRLHSTRGSVTRSGAPARCSHSASCVDAHGRNAPRGKRSRRRSAVSRSSARRRGSTRRTTSSGASAAAHVRRG